MRIGYFPGCSLTGTAREFDLSLRAVAGALGVELVEVADWSCCGASSAHVMNRLLATALPARNLMLAGRQGLGEVAVPCAACYSRLAVAAHELSAEPALRRKVEEVIEAPVDPAAVSVVNVIQLLDRVGADVIAQRRATDLAGLKAACYYGCLLLRPHGATGFDDPEQPSSMERIVKALGATPVGWNFKTECCGAAHSIPRVDIVVDLSKKILDDARAHGADVVVVACPMCHTNLDMRQRAIAARHKGHEAIPVVYLTQLVGLALGIEPALLGLDLHFVDTRPLVAKAAAGRVKELTA